ncbi:hypothetical protein AYR66_00770 [Noviherbaspirillum denitrificans]|uniref:WbqC-like protein n=2 Tax=Noviherbaspirillum denitrificans TaxID=1968433 RepID=A0A254T8U6_9BURK|nr:hypothetical protein AYR66_00770 [Noviherbaspirillum denitrificans]
MQPYLFPYLGYFQLIAAVDTFVIYDDTQLISRGWVNRNRILVNGKPSFITLPLKKAHLEENINARYFVDDIEWHKQKILKAVRMSYSRAPYFKDHFPLIESIIHCTEKNIATFNENAIRKICEYLAIPTTIQVSSRQGFGIELSGKERVLAILKGSGATSTISPIGGLHLYSCDEFMQHGIELKFIKMNDIVYRQFGNAFLPNLSIIDVFMFMDRSEIQERLSDYALTDNLGVNFDEYSALSVDG